MKNTLNIVDEHINQFEGEAREWLTSFVKHMRENYPHLEEVISFQMPTYKLGTGKKRNYIAFGTGKNHFSVHTIDFNYITELKTKLKNPGKGKGCVNVKFIDQQEIPILIEGIQEIIKRSQEDI